METENIDTNTVPTEFKKIIVDFVNDLKLTFEEYNPIINKVFEIKNEPIDDTNKITDEIFQKIFDYCIKKYPPRFFDILYQNVEIFAEESTNDTEFLPNIHFKNLWNDGITDKTKVTIWKYLQLVLFTVIGKVENSDEFGDSIKLFEAINNDNFRSKLEDTFEEMKLMFDKDTENSNTDGTDSDKSFNIPEVDKMHEHLSGILDGKLGSLATEMAEEISSDLNINSDNINSVNDVFNTLVKDPKNLMSMVNKITNKLETKINSGDINQSELLTEASEIMNQFQHMPGMPGMNNMQEMFSKMGMGMNMGGGSGKIDAKATEAQLQRRLKLAKTKERIKAKSDANKLRKAEEQLKQNLITQAQAQAPKYTDEEVVSFFDLKESENNPKTPKKNKKKQKYK